MRGQPHRRAASGATDRLERPLDDLRTEVRTPVGIDAGGEIAFRDSAALAADRASVNKQRHQDFFGVAAAEPPGMKACTFSWTNDGAGSFLCQHKA